MNLLDVIKKAYGFKDDTEIAGLLGKSKSAVSKWRNQGLPAAVEKRMVSLLREKGITPHSVDVSASGVMFEPIEFESQEHALLWEECKQLSKNGALAALLELRKKKEVRNTTSDDN